MRVAIQPDDFTNPKIGKSDASSPRWARLIEAAGHEVRRVDVRRPDILDQVRDCDGFMWRHSHAPVDRDVARRLLPVLERELGIATYPDQATCWHFDDKIAQSFLFAAHDIPTPRTWTWFDRDQARAWLEQAELPLVLKLASGAGSTNVRLVRTREEAANWVDRLFFDGVVTLQGDGMEVVEGVWRRVRGAARVLLRGRKLPLRAPELHRGYVLFQEFLPGNDFDTRVTVIGNRAFAYRRQNRPGDFRASGSGVFDPDPEKIDLDTVRLAFRIAQKLRAQSVAIDGLRRGDERVVTEVSYAYVSWMVHDCPGHWEEEDGQPVWKAGAMWPEEAQVEDFLARLAGRESRGTPPAPPADPTES
jgi:glutathione synthase/RimK-type ligase-like ATP-grasp enzyme